jgi:nicotinamidase-related amidase
MESEPTAASGLSIDLSTAALVLIDLQVGIVGRPTVPHAAGDVVARAVRLADCFRAAAATVVLVHVGFASDGQDRPPQQVDAPLPSTGQMPPNWSDLVPQLNVQPGDLTILKHQWGAFYGTELDLQLRRRGVRTIVLAGIATNFGVESTARDAWERNYNVVFVEDAMSSMAKDAHEFAVKSIFPRLGRVRSTEEVVRALR